MALFKLIGIKSPGRVDVYKHGLVELESISDELAEKLWREGCPYLTLTEEGTKKFYPNRTAITVEPISVQPILSSNRKSKQKKTSGLK